MTKNLHAIVDQIWVHLDDNSEENAQTGAVTISLNKLQARNLYQLYWDAGGEYRAALKECGWSPVSAGTDHG